MKNKHKISVLVAAILSAVCLAGCTEKETSDITVSETYTETSLSAGSDGKTYAQTKTTDIFTERDLCLTPDLSESTIINAENDSEYVINSGGVYYLTGTANNFTVRIEADKKDKVQIVPENADITNENKPVIYVVSADKCFISPVGENTLNVIDSFAADGDTEPDAVIFSKDDLVFNGTGILNINSSYGNAVTAKDSFKATGGSYNITCANNGIDVNDSISICGGQFDVRSEKDAIHCKNSKDDTLGSVYIENGSFVISAKSDGIQATSKLVIDGGSFDITSAEGLESTYIQINGGDISIKASDDGINATAKSSAYSVVVEFNGGNTVIEMGQGDTDGVDSNGDIIINGGTIDVKGVSTFDYDGKAEHNGGVVIVNGSEVDEIPQSMFGGDRDGFGPKAGQRPERDPNSEHPPFEERIPPEDRDFDPSQRFEFDNGNRPEMTEKENE